MFLKMTGKHRMLSDFDPSKEDHVLWLKKAGDAFRESMTGKSDFMKAVSENPITEDSVTPIQWAQIHFGLAMKYTDAVFDGTAYIPK
jgi:hypothetical protein